MVLSLKVIGKVQFEFERKNRKKMSTKLIKKLQQSLKKMHYVQVS